MTIKTETEPAELLTYQQAAERCKVDHTFIRKAVRSKELRAVVLGPKAHRIHTAELARWWKSKQTKGVVTPA